MIECKTLNGNTKLVPKQDLILRPAAYAIIVNQGKLLVLRLRHSGKFHLPGGGVYTGERISETIKREVHEETGLDIEVGTLAHFDEIFFHYDPTGRSYHGLHFYYICAPKTIQLKMDDQVDDFAAEKPRWVEITTLQPQDFQIHGNAIVSICNKLTDV